MFIYMIYGTENFHTPIGTMIYVYTLYIYIIMKKNIYTSIFHWTDIITMRMILIKIRVELEEDTYLFYTDIF